MKTYLVTGAAGFIGSNFVSYILKNFTDIKIISLDNLGYAGNLDNLKAWSNHAMHEFVRADICDAQAIRNVFNSTNIDVVVHFAAESHVDRSIEDPLTFVNTNVLGTATLLNAAKDAWGQSAKGGRAAANFAGHKFLHVSTDEVYGSLGPEGFFTEDTPLDPHSPYSASKAASDLLVKSYFDTYGFPINITRCSNNYGPYQFPEKLIPLMIANAMAHKNLPVYGDGMNVRDWLYVEDHCRAIQMVISSGKLGEIYNIGGHNECTNIDIVRQIIGALSQKVDSSIDESLISFVEDRLGHDRRYAIDPAKISAEIGWEPATKFSDGLAKTIDWYLENQKWVQDIVCGEYKNYYDKMYGTRKQVQGE